MHDRQQGRRQAVHRHPDDDDPPEATRRCNSIHEPRDQDPSDPECREQVPVSAAPGSQLVLADDHEEHRVGAVHEAREDAETREERDARRRHECANADAHLLQRSRGAALGDVRGMAPGAHPADHQGREAERGGVDTEDDGGRAEQQQQSRDRRPDDDGQVLDNRLRAVGGCEVFLTDDDRGRRAGGGVV